jgi:uncharacterized protein YkwD
MMISRACRIVGMTVLSACSVAPSTTRGGTTQPSTPAPPATSSGATDYRRIEREVVAELNAARINPSGYAKHLSDLIPMFDGTLRRRPGAVSVRTNEGAAAVREGVNALLSQTAVPVLVLNDRLSQAARDLVADQSRTGNLGHTGTDGSTPGTRIARYGTWGVSYSENVDYGSVSSGREVIIDLLVDDGVPGRGHRTNIFDPSARVAGVACGPHPKYGVACVIDQTGAFTAK